MTEMKFEVALKQLEEIVSKLEAGDMSLDDSLSKYEEGIKLSKLCSRQLEAAKSRVELLMKSGGKFDIRPFEDTMPAGKPKTKPRRSRKSDGSASLF